MKSIQKSFTELLLTDVPFPSDFVPRFMAMDVDGCWHVFQQQPLFDGHFWYVPNIEFYEIGIDESSDLRDTPEFARSISYKDSLFEIVDWQPEIKVLLECRLIKTNFRLTFDILSQHPDVTYSGDDDGDYFKFTASNGYEVISRSRMDIQTERLWLLGAKPNERSGSMVFSSNEKRDQAYDAFMLALNEWSDFNGGTLTQVEPISSSKVLNTTPTETEELRLKFAHLQSEMESILKFATNSVKTDSNSTENWRADMETIVRKIQGRLIT